MRPSRRCLGLFSYERESQMPTTRYVPKKKDRKSMVLGWGGLKPGCLGFRYLLDNPENIVNHEVSLPSRLPFSFRHNVSRVAAGHAFSLLATSQGLFGCGTNHVGQLGPSKEGSSPYILEPRKIPLPDLKLTEETIVSISAGDLHSLIATTDRVWALGSNRNGCLGRPIIDDEDYRAMKFVGALDGIPRGAKIKAVVAGPSASYILLQDGRVLSFGCNRGLQLGRRSKESTDWRPSIVSIPEPIQQLSASEFSVLAVSSEGNVYGWGNSEWGQLSAAIGNLPCATEPTKLKLPFKAKSVATRGAIVTVISEDGQAWVWGSGPLGLGPDVRWRRSPVQMPRPLFGSQDAKVAEIVTNGSQCLGRNEAGAVFAWGQEEGETKSLGLGLPKASAGFQAYPLQVAMPAPVFALAIGTYHCFALARNVF